ncbi:MAG: ATP-binding protein [Clostridia bacterium]
MAKIIPKRTKIKIELFKNITIVDIILGVIAIVVAIIFFRSNFGGLINIWIGIAWLLICITMFVPIADGERFYMTLLHLFRFSAQQKKYSKEKIKGSAPISQILPFDDIVEGRYISFKNYYAQVFEVNPIEFGILDSYKQELLLDNIGKALHRLNTTQVCSIMKINKAMILDNYIYNEDKKYDNLLELQYNGEMSPAEIEARSGVFEERVTNLEASNRNEKIYKDFFYIVVYDKDKVALENTVNAMMSTLANSVTSLSTHRLETTEELAVFLKANYGKEFDERELEGVAMQSQSDWAKPNNVKFQASRVLINNKPYRQFVISDYPLQVQNAWGAPLFLLDRTRVNVKITPLAKFESEKAIDKAIAEMQGKLFGSGVSSKIIENKTHLETLQNLLMDMKNNNQQLFDVNSFIICEEPAKKEVRAILRQEGFKCSELFGRQVDAFVSSNVSMRDTIKETKRGIPTTTLSAIFPFVSGALQDVKGFYIGDNEYPVFVDFFKRDYERVNSNIIIIGKSGSGKSYATKTLLANFSADNTKVFILDPENEYSTLVNNLHGKMIDVGSSMMGIINPFHITTSLESDEGGVDDSFSLHLQFLEQFFKVILEGISSDAFETLNSCVVEVYKKKGIDFKTKFEKFKPGDYPVFDDLFELIEKKIVNETNEYHKTNLIIIGNYIRKFATGGRNSNLWNGPTSIVTRENFVCFNFQSLIANNNQVIANAQMLLIFRYLMNEIVKNKEFNAKLKVKRKIIVAVDEAHIFINPKYPIALDFMQQMAKRIRKYDGMQIIITQNIKDFVGSEEIQRQSTAVINASQYSMIFSLNPVDITDLVELYRKAGEINQEEQNTIVTAGVGECFLITGPRSRTVLKIVPLPYVKKLFD